MPKKRKPWVLATCTALFIYPVLTFFIGLDAISTAPAPFTAFLQEFKTLWWLKLILCLAALLVILLLSNPPLDIKDQKVGHGQHGDARYMEDEEVKEHYTLVPFGQEKEPGFVVGLTKTGWVIDTSDNNAMLLSPPGGGKTTGFFIPTAIYNGRVNSNTGGNGASLILVDIKGTLYNQCAPQMQKHGYRTPVINLREVFCSYHYNIIHRVNQEIDLYKKSKTPKEKALHYGRAEKYAKVVAAEIIGKTGSPSSSEGSEYFNEAAKGLIIGLILMVSEYAPSSARHIMSVYDLIIQLSGQEETGLLTGVQTSKLSAMMKNVQNRRIQSYVGVATGADIRTTLNIFSSALAKLIRFVDAELEQLLCDQSPELEAQAFIDSPTAIFIICPDENRTRHFLASLFIRTLSNDVIELAETKYKEKLPRQVFYFLDEFGNLPAIQDVVSLFSAVRSRGGRVLCALQSYAQLLDNYSKDKADIIRDTCQMLIFSFVAPSAETTATTLSKMLGNETILSGSTSVSRGVTTTSSQMIGRPLLSVSQLVTLPKNIFIVYKGTQNPYRSKLNGYWEYLELEETLQNPVPGSDYEEIILVSARFIGIMASGQAIKLKKGMFD